MKKIWKQKSNSDHFDVAQGHPERELKGEPSRTSDHLDSTRGRSEPSRMSDKRLLESLFENRGLRSPEEVENFLDPRYERSFDPGQLRDMDAAVKRIGAAMAHGEQITIYADYDADAVTAAAVLIRFLRKAGHGRVDYYIPDRFSEGYGMNADAVKLLAKRGTKLIVTVDCGINAVDAVDIATYLGMDVIITDHHQVTGVLPRAAAVINPHRADDGYPFKDLTGVGVAFKLVQALVKNSKIQDSRFKIQDGWEKWLLDLVAIGTVADCQSLLGENRIFVKWGLTVMRKTQWIGLGSLLNEAGIADTPLDTYKIGFVIAPRINAAGRIEHANLALELLLTESLDEAAELSRKLSELNRRRQDLTQQILSEAREQITPRASGKILLAASEGWPRGIVGLVAGKLAEEFYRPVLILEKGEEEAVGSARSIQGFDIVKAISRSEEILVRFGGHPMAAGFTIRNEHIEIFHQKLLEHAEAVLPEDALNPALSYEAVIEPRDLSEELIETLEKFAPFGLGNPRPRVRVNNLIVLSARTIGNDGKHLRLSLSQNGKTFSAVAFNQGFWAAKLPVNSKIDIICEPQFNEWNGERKVQLKIVDLEISNSAT